MGLDPQVPLQVKVPEPIDPLQTMGQVMSLRQMAQQGQLHDLQIQNEQMQVQGQQRQLREQDQLRALFSDPSITDEDTLIRKVMAINPTVGQNLQKSMLEGKKTRLDLAIKRTDRLAQIAGGIVPGDETSYHSAIAQAAGEGLFGEGPQGVQAAQQLLSLPPGPERDAHVKAFLSQALSAKDQLEEQRKTLEFPADLAKKQADADESASKALNLQVVGAASRLRAALKTGGPTAYGRLLDSLSDDVASRFPAATFPSLNEDAIRTAALTPEQSQTAETASERLDLSRDRLALARQREAREASQGTLSPSQRGVIERNKAMQLASLERQLRADTKNIYQNPKTGARSPEDQAAYDAAVAKLTEEKLRVENSYRAQLGLEPLESGWGTPAGSAAAPPARPAPVGATRTATGKFTDPAMRAAARAALQNAGYTYDDSSIDVFLSKPGNRAGLGYK